MRKVKGRKSGNFNSRAHENWAFELKTEIKEFSGKSKDSLIELKEENQEEIVLIREEIKDTCKTIFDDEGGGIIFQL